MLIQTQGVVVVLPLTLPLYRRGGGTPIAVSSWLLLLLLLQGGRVSVLVAPDDLSLARPDP